MKGKFNWVASAGFAAVISLSIAGCSGSSIEGSGLAEAVAGTVSAIGSGMESVMDTTVVESTVAALGLNPNGNGKSFINCEETEDEVGTTVVCDCEEEGTVTHAFNETIDHDGTCERGNENNSNPGKVHSFLGSASVTFDNCVIERCGELITLNGSVEEEVSFVVNTCDQSESHFTVDVQTSGDCEGLDVTVGEETTVLGVNVNISKTHGPKEASGNVCVNGESVPFENMSQLRKALNSEGFCAEEESEDVEQVEEEESSESST